MTQHNVLKLIRIYSAEEDNGYSFTLETNLMPIVDLIRVLNDLVG